MTKAFEKKFIEQARAAQTAGVPIDFIVINTAISTDSEHIKFIKISSSRNSLRKNISTHFFKYHQIDRYFDLRSYGRIILRYMTPVNKFAVQWIRTYPGKIISEHHTNEVGEFNGHLKRIFPLRTSATILVSRYLEEKYAPSYLKETAGMIALTDEIRRIELQKSGPKPSAVISNGIDVESIPVAKRSPYDGKTLNLIFAASNFSPWQGLDRVLEGLARYGGGARLRLFLVGVVPAHYHRMIEKVLHDNAAVEISLHGERSGRELNDLFDRAHLSFGPLALFKNNMRQACSLKTRDQIARQIPLIYAYDDVDLSGHEDFALKLPAENSPLNFDEIVRFAEKACCDQSLGPRMREFALLKLDWRIKVKQMFDFALGLP
jgi:hypothetical protein